MRILAAVLVLVASTTAVLASEADTGGQLHKLVDGIVDLAKNHRELALPIIFALAFGESIAFVSLILPFWGALIVLGAVLPESGVNMWLIWVAASTGAAFGDWFSYWLGWHYHRQIAAMWPLSRHPDLLPRGKALFDRWGEWAIWIARFSGPLRASVPIVAGAVQMRSMVFQRANWPSAFLWAGVLLLFGDVIGKTIGYVYRYAFGT